MDDDTQNILEGRRGYSCRAAADAFRVFLSSDAADDRPQDPDSGVVQKQHFYRWVSIIGRNLPVTHLIGSRPGREHHVLALNSNTVLKTTFPSRAGYHVTIDPDDGIEFNNSLPLDYLERQALQAELFGVPCEFLGVMGASHRFQLVVAQQRVIGEPATYEAIRDTMLEIGFEELPRRYSQGELGSLSFFNEEFAVFDLRPANVVQAPNGLCIPIDGFVSRVDSVQVSYLRGLCDS